MAEPKVRMTFDQLTTNLIEDALSYYLMSTQGDGPDDHSPARIRRVLDRFSAARTKLDEAWWENQSIGSDVP